MCVRGPKFFEDRRVSVRAGLTLWMAKTSVNVIELVDLAFKSLRISEQMIRH